jgi:hypothetical protein
MDFLAQASVEIVLLIAAALATVGALIYAKRSNRPRLSADGLSGARQQSMTTAQGAVMTQAVAGRSEAQPQRRQSIVAQVKNATAAVRRR